MSEALEQATQQSIDYMIRLLQMNPVQKCEEIISARSAELGRPNNTDLLKQAAVQTKADRQNVLAQLDLLRAQFWSLSQDALEDRLAQLNAHGYADVAAAVARLRVVAAHRDEFPKLAEKLKFDRYVLDSLKGILTTPPREALELKERELVNLASGTSRKSGRRFAKLVKREMPAIYQLESEWFDSLGRRTAHGTVSGAYRSGTPVLVGSARGKNFWWIVGVAAFGIVRVLMLLPDPDQREANHYRSGYAPPSNWQLNSTPTPTYTPENNSSGGQRSGESKPVPRFGLDKDLWKPYPTSDQKDVWKPYDVSDHSNDRNQNSPRSR